MGKITLNEEKILKYIKNHLETIDADEFARIIGEMFGGSCFAVSEDENDFGSDIVYEFTPNIFYSEAFDTWDGWSGENK